MTTKDDTVRYGWEFPDGKVIPEDDEYRLMRKLEGMDSFRETLSDDELKRGYWYTDHYYDSIQRDIDGMSDDEMFDIYGVKRIYPKGNGDVKYRLPDGRRVDESGLFDWIVDEGYPFERWFKYEQYGDEFKDYLHEEAERLINWDKNELAHYGIKRVPIRVKAGKKTVGNSVKGKPSAKSKSASIKGKPQAPKSNTDRRFVSSKGKGKRR